MMRKAGFVWIALCAANLLFAGCSADESDQSTKELAEPNLDGKTDAADQVSLKGRLFYGDDEALENSFTKDLEFHGYTLDVAQTSTLTLEVTQKGSSRGLDTTLFVYGPEKSGSFGDAFLMRDDDDGFGKLSRLKEIKLEAGRYLVVVGTADAAGRGNYRVMASCLEGQCEAPVEDVDLNECPAELEDLLRECVDETIFEFDTSLSDAWQICLENMDIVDTFEGLCFEDAFTQAPAWCAAGEDAFAENFLPNCVDKIDEELTVSSDVELTRKEVSSELDEEVFVGMDTCDGFCEMEVFAFTFATPDGQPLTTGAGANAAIAKVLNDEILYSVGGEMSVDDMRTEMEFRSMVNFLALSNELAQSDNLIIGTATAFDTPFAGVDAFHTAFVLIYNDTNTMIVLDAVDFSE